jgi:hypothetical protein
VPDHQVPSRTSADVTSRKIRRRAGEARQWQAARPPRGAGS